MRREGPRVVVGFTGSLANIAALRAAVNYARDWRRPMLAVFACPTREGYPRRGHRTGPPASPETVAARLGEALIDGFGVLPVDLGVEFVVGWGSPADVLMDTAGRPGDLLVIGASRGGLARLWRPTVSAECRSRARQLIVVPRPPMLDELGQLRRIRDIRDIRGLASI